METAKMGTGGAGQDPECRDGPAADHGSGAVEAGGAGAADGTEGEGAETAAGGGRTEESAAGPEAGGLAERVAALEAELAAANDNYLRKAADFENFRKRRNQETQNALDYANQALLLDLLSVIDDFERAIRAAETQREAAGDDAGQIAVSFTSLYEGITMIEKNLVSQLENKWGLKRFDSAGEPFDPNRHEAIMMEKSAAVEEPVVAEEFIKGYSLKDRVIRAAKVKVIMPEANG
ncbi:MAG: nucleotide exchange factor GrpE [Treponema sp.]|nr:nucleotide exchange factor GrpE [Treponema sp.]